MEREWQEKYLAALAREKHFTRAALAETKQLQPELSVEWVEKHHVIIRPEDWAIYIEGLRRAGLK